MTQEAFTLHHLLQFSQSLVLKSLFYLFFLKQISSLHTVKSVTLFLGELFPLVLPSLGNCPHKQEGQPCPGSP